MYSHVERKQGRPVGWRPKAGAEMRTFSPWDCFGRGEKKSLLGQSFLLDGMVVLERREAEASHEPEISFEDLP